MPCSLLGSTWHWFAPILGDNNFDGLLTMGHSKVLHYKVTTFALTWLISHCQEDTLRLCKYTVCQETHPLFQVTLMASNSIIYFYCFISIISENFVSVWTHEILFNGLLSTITKILGNSGIIYNFQPTSCIPVIWLMTSIYLITRASVANQTLRELKHV